MKFSDLEFVRLQITKPEDVNAATMLFNMIPRELFEQVKDRSFDIDKLYRLSNKLVKASNKLLCPPVKVSC